MSDQKSTWLNARAYAIWEAAGRPMGQDHEHWAKAVAEYALLEQTRASLDGQDVLLRRRRSVPAVTPAITSEAAARQAVLVVDDDARLRFDTVELLEAAGYDVREAANADEALVHLRRSAFNSVVTDINMPGSLDGLGLTSQIRSLWPKTKVILSSGLVRLNAADLPSGVSFLLKPVKDAALLALLGVQSDKRCRT